MKKAIFIASLLAVIVPSVAFADFDTSLKYGSRGPKVQEVQEFLIDQGYMTGTATGNFYSITLRAVKAFQSAQAIQPVSGFWGPLSRAAGQAILDQELAQSNLEASTTPVVVPQQATTTQNAPQSPAIAPPQAPATQPAPSGVTLAPVAPQPSQAHITIVSEGYYTQHIDSPHCIAPASVPSADAVTADCQAVQLGVFVYDDQGFIVKNADLMATTTDPAQNRVIHGTGNADGHYDYSYLFRGPSSTIYFSSPQGLASVTMNAQ